MAGTGDGLAITFGSAMVDIIAVLDSSSVEKISLSNANSQFLLIEPGNKVEAESISTHIGGGGINTAVSLGRLGMHAMPLVKTGDDPSRDHVVEHLRDNGLSDELTFVTPGQTTGSAVMLATHERNAAIFTQRGANTSLVTGDLESLAGKKPALIHAAPLSGQSSACLPAIAAFAGEAGAFFSSNPGIRQISSRCGTILAGLKFMDLISINASEAAAMVPCLSAAGYDQEWKEPADGEPAVFNEAGRISLRQVCEAMALQGARRVLVTFGSQGAWLFDDGDLHHQPVVKTSVAGTAGAGDSFVSTLAWGLHCGHPPANALLLAAHNASSVVSYVNTTDGLLHRDALLERAGLAAG